MPITWHAQLQFADARHQSAAVVARTIAASRLAALIGRSAQQLGHFRFEHFLKRILHERLHQIPVVGNQRFR